MNKLKIAILFGGCSEEHDVSVKSAIEIADHIDPEKYEPLYIGITRSGVWNLCAKPRLDWEDGPCRSAVLSPDRTMHGLLMLGDDGYQIEPVDAAFPVLHGKTGEDGAIQGLFELSGIPYVGCDIQSSAVCMDKSLTYLVVRSAGVATPAFLTFHSGERPDAMSLPYPIFVKPARSGSSFGVSKVLDASELDAAFALARQYDNKVLIEQAVPGIEVGCAVLGNGADLIVGAVDQITLSHGIFRIHQEDHPEQGSDNAIITVPAALSAEQRAEIQTTAKTIYQALGCQGLARVDLFLQADGRLILNEVNTLPGFTAYSRYPRMMSAAGMSLSWLIDQWITLAMKSRST